MRTNGIKKNHKIYIFKHQQTESGGGGGANLENNKTATIDVSAYIGPVAINPSAGKDGMKKATVTLNNIPSGGVTKLYAWSNNYDALYTVTESPSVGDIVIYSTDNSSWITPETVSEVSEEGIKTSLSDEYFARHTRGDISLV